MDTNNLSTTCDEELLLASVYFSPAQKISQLRSFPSRYTMHISRSPSILEEPDIMFFWLKYRKYTHHLHRLLSQIALDILQRNPRITKKTDMFPTFALCFFFFPTWQHDHGTMAIFPWPTQQTCDLWRRRRRCGSSRLPPGAPNTSWFKMQFLMVFFPKIWWPFQGLKTQNPGQLQSRKEGDQNHPESHDFHHQYPVEAIWDSCAGRMAVFRPQMG